MQSISSENFLKKPVAFAQQSKSLKNKLKCQLYTLVQRCMQRPACYNKYFCHIKTSMFILLNAQCELKIISKARVHLRSYCR